MCSANFGRPCRPGDGGGDGAEKSRKYGPVVVVMLGVRAGEGLMISLLTLDGPGSGEGSSELEAANNGGGGPG
jgi:hypothetical protein